MTNKIMESNINTLGGVKEPQLSEALLFEFSALIQSRFGILVKKDFRELGKTILSECINHKISADEYLQQLRNSDDNSALFNYLITNITIGETYFFRDKQQIKILSEVILPEIVMRKRANKDYTIRIWSAGCSSGEEIYTIVMLLRNLLDDFDQWKHFYLATDINVEVLKKAISGQFTEWSMRSIPEFYLQRYFKKDGFIYKLSDEIMDCVNFEYLNLNGSTYPSILNGTLAQDLVICRNVLIYFDYNHAARILGQLSKCIVNEGYILLGASDPIVLNNTGLKSAKYSPSLLVQDRAEDVSSISVKLPDTKNTEYVIHERVVIDKNIIKQETVKPQRVPLMADDGLDKLIIEEKWQEIVSALTRMSAFAPLSVHQLNSMAIALANLGKTTDALHMCEKALELDRLNKMTYFIYALSLSEINQFNEAESAFKKALYIDPEFLICRYQYGVFLLRQKKSNEGIKLLKGVINTVSKYNLDDSVPNYVNLNYKQLIAMLTNEIELHQ